jgi:Right handed beta helix region
VLLGRGRSNVGFCLLAVLAAVTLAGCFTQTRGPSAVSAGNATLNASLSCRAGFDGHWTWQWRELGTAAWTSGGGFRIGCPQSLARPSFRLAGLKPDTTYQYRMTVDVGHGAPTAWIDAAGVLDGTRWSTVTTQPQCDDVQGATESLRSFVASNPAGNKLDPRVLCVRAGTQEIGQLNSIRAWTVLTPRGEANGTKQIAVLNGNVGVEQPGITLEDLRIAGCYRQAGCASDRDKTIDVRADSATLRHLDITQRNGRNADILQCVLISGGQPVVGTRIEFSKIHGCGSESSGNLEHGIYCSDARLPLIKGNWIYDNEGFGVQLYPNCDGAQTIGNVVADNGGACDVDLSDQVAYANGFCGFARERFTPIHCGASSGNRGLDMVLYDPAVRGTTDCGGGRLAQSGTYSADPQFYDRARYDFRMKNPFARAKLGLYAEIVPGPRW